MKLLKVIIANYDIKFVTSAAAKKKKKTGSRKPAALLWMPF